ncbi:MAG: CRISPR-associated endonuclease Cas2 [Candidatus Firestonebacteria bacterium]
MLVVITYDVNTMDAEGRRRLRRVAKTCKNFGQRVQLSVFECDVDPEQWARLKNGLCNIIDPEKDSIRFYYLGSNWKRRVEHVGAKESISLDEPLLI